MNLEQHIKKNAIKPHILSQSNIPKPLHGVNPRSIMGKEKWDVVRREVYASTGYRCAACGVHKDDAMFHKWLEAHEDYEIDHESAIMTVRSMVPLCHSCHSFVHSGFLFVQLERGEKSKSEVAIILDHGFGILKSARLPAFVGLKNVIKASGWSGSWSGGWLHPRESSKRWDEWVMIWEGEKFPAKFKSYDEWVRFYR